MSSRLGPVGLRGCPGCSGTSVDKARSLGTGPSALFRCLSCATEFVWPQPSDERLAMIYGPSYLAPWSHEDSAVLERMKQLTFDRLLDLCPVTTGSVVLEVGCATGAMLAAAARRGARVFGIDVNATAIERARRRLPQATLHVGTVTDDPFPGVTFDVVIMVDVIEHVRDPDTDIGTVRCWMRQGSHLLVSTPNVTSPLRRVMGRFWPQYRDEHLTYFSPRGITRLCERHHLRIEKIVPTRKAITLSYALGQAVTYPIPVVTPVVRLAYRAAVPLRHRPVWLRFGEMTVVARA